MKNLKYIAILVVTASVTLSNQALANCGACAGDKETTTAHSHGTQDIVALAAGSDQFTTLVAAVKAAGLVEVLQGEGPYTVFAPTDAAFAKLPKGTVENLLKPENRDQLIAILKYHVVPGKVMAADVKTMKAPTAQGQSVNIKVTSQGVTVDDAKVVKTDLVAKNGVIHVIDTVILPRS